MNFLNQTKNLLLSIILMLMTGCGDYLDVSDEIAENLTLEEVFENPNYTRGWHGNLFNCISEYSSLGLNQNDGLSGVWSCLCGEATICGTGIVDVVSGYTPYTAAFHRWSILYQYIRDAHIFLNQAHPLGSIHDRYQITEADINRMKDEAKFLIAYSYFSLFELYGPVPIIDGAVDPEMSNLDFARSSVDEMIAYIDSLLVDIIASDQLPHTLIVDPAATGNDKYNLNEIVRPTITVVKALRAKLWVYASSPLFNGGYKEALQLTNGDGKKLFSSYEPQKWMKAKECLEDLFDDIIQNGHKLFYCYNEDGTINPDESYYQLFQAYNDEILWATGKNYYNDSTMERNTDPRDCYDGWAYLGASQELVDAYFMSNGLTIKDPGSEYREDGFADVQNPCNENKKVDVNVFNMYANREPRFYASIGYEGKSWHIQPIGNPDYALGFAVGEGCDISSVANPRTGYFPTKFKNRKLLFTGDYLKNWARPSILFRLADFYLYYAEVCNEIDPNDPNVIIYLDKIRERAGIPGYQYLAKTGKKNIMGNQELQREMIQRERQVELAFEGQRYFDIRRWMICEAGESADQSLFSGMNMNGYKDKPIGAFNSYFTRVSVEDRVWRRSMYLYPIPQDEVNKSKLLVQNPLW